MNAPRSGLGKGLAALLPDAAGAAPGASLQLPVDQVRPNPFQPRRDFEPEALSELVESIKTHGVLQAITVRPAPTGGGYELIAGERRLRAARLAGLPTIPAVVRPSTEQEMIELALVENLQREDINPLEAADAYRRCLDEFGYTQEQLAARLGKSRTAVANTLRLLRLPAPVREALAAGQLTEGHGRALLSLPDEPTMLSAAERIVADGLSVRAAEALCRGPRLPRSGSTTKRPKPTTGGASRLADADLEAVRQRLERGLGARVDLKYQSGGDGAVIVHFYGQDDLERLLARLLPES